MYIPKAKTLRRRPSQWAARVPRLAAALGNIKVAIRILTKCPHVDATVSRVLLLFVLEICRYERNGRNERRSVSRRPEASVCLLVVIGSGAARVCKLELILAYDVAVDLQEVGRGS